MARKYSRDNRGRFAGGGGGATARGGRLKTAAGNKRKTQTMESAAKPKGTIGKPKGLKPGAIKAKAAQPTKVAPKTRKQSLETGSAKNTARANKIDAKVASMEKIYRSKDSAFYTQPVKTSERDRMHAMSQRASKLRDESASLREKASNAARMASKIKTKAPKNSGGNARLQRAINNEIAGVGTYRGNRKGYQKRITALAAQKVYKTGNSTANLSVSDMTRKGFRLPRATAKPTAKPARATATKRIRAAAPRNTTANKTGSSKTLNKFNSRPVGTMVAGKGINLVPSKTRVPLNVATKESDRAFGRIATKASRARAAAPAKADLKQAIAARTARAEERSKSLRMGVVARSGRPTKKERKSIMLLEAAKDVYHTKRADTLLVNTKKPGYKPLGAARATRAMAKRR